MMAQGWGEMPGGSGERGNQEKRAERRRGSEREEDRAHVDEATVVGPLGGVELAVLDKGLELAHVGVEGAVVGRAGRADEVARTEEGRVRPALNDTPIKYGKENSRSLLSG